MCLQLAAALRVFWWRRGHAREGGEHLDELLNSCGGPTGAVSVVARANALAAAGWLRLVGGALAQARSFLEQALVFARELMDGRLIGIVLNYLGQVAFQSGEPAAARLFLEEALALAQEVGGWPRWHLVVKNLASVAASLGELNRALSLNQECLDFGQQLGDTHFTGQVCRGLGDLAIDRGDLTAARAYLAEGLLTVRTVADSEVAPVLVSFAGLAAAASDPQRALRLAGGSFALRRVIAAPLPPFEVTRLHRRLEPARRVLGEAAARFAWAEGEAMTLEELVAYALEPSEARPEERTLRHGPPGRLKQSSYQPPESLTPREHAVARLLARGLSNREIAQELVISRGTAEVHVKHILAKLGFTSRGQLAA